MKNKRFWVLFGGIVLIGATFLFLNFRVAASIKQTENFFIFKTDMGDNMPVPMQRRDKISLVLVGEGPMVRALQKELTVQMIGAGLGEIELEKEFEPIYPNPVLVIKVGKPSPIWTPLFAMSQFYVHAGYASNGDSTFMDEIEKSHTSVGKKDVANMYAEYEVKDRSFGLISRPGYHQFLADFLAQEIVTALKDLYHTQ